MTFWGTLLTKNKKLLYWSDKINGELTLDRFKGAKNMKYNYGITSNMIHSGKEVFSDTDRLSESLI